MERKYQIFISSTYVDLIDERKKVVEQILNNYHFPIGMEMFEASDKRQWDVIKQTIDTSDIYVLIVGNRYGSCDPTTGLSYTEMEYDYAQSEDVNKPTLVFYSEDTDFKKQIKNLQQRFIENPNKRTSDLLEDIYRYHYDEDQEKIQDFRKKVLNKMSKQFSRHYHIDTRKGNVIKRDVNIDTAASILRKIRELPTGGWIRQQEGYGTVSIQNRLKIENAGLFGFGDISNIEFARVLPTGQSLESEANFSSILQTTQTSFSILTNAFKQFYFHELAVEECLKRGVHFRILLINPFTEIEGACNSHWVYHPDTAFGNRNRNKLVADLDSTLDRINIAKNKAELNDYPGSIEVRFYSKPVYYQMWIQDSIREDSIAQINIAHFNGFKPHFRITSKTSNRLFLDLVKQFDIHWNDSVDQIVADLTDRSATKSGKIQDDSQADIVEEISKQLHFNQKRREILLSTTTFKHAENDIARLHQLLNQQVNTLQGKGIIKAIDSNPHSPNYFILATDFHSVSFFWKLKIEDKLQDSVLEVCTYDQRLVTRRELLEAIPGNGMKDCRNYLFDVTTDLKLAWKLDTTDVFFTIDEIVDSTLKWLLQSTKASISKIK